MNLVKVFFKSVVGNHNIGDEAFVASGFMRNYLYPRGLCEYCVNVEEVNTLKKDVQNLIRKALDKQEKNVSLINCISLLKCIVIIAKATDSGILHSQVKEKNILISCLKLLQKSFNVNLKTFAFKNITKKLSSKCIKVCGVYSITFESGKVKHILPVIVSQTRLSAISTVVKQGILTQEETGIRPEIVSLFSRRKEDEKSKSSQPEEEKGSDSE